MTSLSEQLSAQFSAQFGAIRNSQLEAQLDLLQTWGSRAINSAEQLISLNLRASRTSVEQATGTFKQLLDATKPQDVIAVGSRAQGQWHYLFEYSRELFGIASGGALLQTWTTQPSTNVPSAPVQIAQAADVAAPVAQAAARAESVTESVAQPVAEAATETAEAAADVVDNGVAAAYQAAEEATEQQADALQQQADAAIETAIADDVPPARTTLLAQALNDVAPKPASAEHPIAATIALEAHDHVELPIVTPMDVTPPVHTPVPPPAKERRNSRTRK